MSGFGIPTSGKFKKHYPKTVSEMMSDIITPTEFYLNNRFLVLLPDKYVPGGDDTVAKVVAANCVGTVVPGNGFQIVERRESSQTFKVPYDHSTQNLTLTFRCSNSFVERKYFTFWFEDIFNPVYRSYNYFKGTSLSSGDGYAQAIDIVLLSNLGTGGEGNRFPIEVLHVKIFDAFPVNLGDIQISYDNNDTIATFDVEIAYLYHVVSNRANIVDEDAILKVVHAKSMEDFTALYGSGGVSPETIAAMLGAVTTQGASFLDRILGGLAGQVINFAGDIIHRATGGRVTV